MALQLKAEYTKKVGLPGYSSHGLNLTLTREVTSLKEIDEVVAETYQLLQDAVDRELVQTGWLPDSEQPAARNGNQEPDNGGFAHQGRNGSNRNGRAAPESPQGGWRCSDKQKSLIQRVSREQGLSFDDLDALAQTRFGKPVRELDKLRASSLIDELLDNRCGPTQGKRNGIAGVEGRNGR